MKKQLCRIVAATIAPLSFTVSASAEELTNRGATNLLSEIDYLQAQQKPLPGPFIGNELRELRADTVFFVLCNGGSVDDWLEHTEQILPVANRFSDEPISMDVDPSYFTRVGAKGCDQGRANAYEVQLVELQQVEATIEHNSKVAAAIGQRAEALNSLVGINF